MGINLLRVGLEAGPVLLRRTCSCLLRLGVWGMCAFSRAGRTVAAFVARAHSSVNYASVF